MTKDTSGLDRAREVVAIIKGEIEEQHKQEEKIMTENKTKAISQLKVSAEALAFMKARALEDRGVEVNEGGSLPVLTLIQNEEFTQEMADGQDPISGAYYYKPKQIQIKNPVVNIIYVKECRLDSEYQKVVTKGKAHYLIAGILEGTNDPFIMYIKGLSYGEVAIEETSLMNQTRPWRKHAQNPVPLYLFRIQLGSVKKQSIFGAKRATTYLMIKNDDGTPNIITNIDTMEMLDATVDSSKRIIDGIIKRNEIMYDDNFTVEPVPVPVAESLEDNIPF